MEAQRVRRVTAHEGYETWAASYDETANPIVTMDSRHTTALLQPRQGDRILDAGCGTGRHLPAVAAAGALAVGVDFSVAMLKVARRRAPNARLVAADLRRRLPFLDAYFDAALCALVAEHIDYLPSFFSELRRALKSGGRLVFSVYHPEMAAAGVEANFTAGGVEYRLGAVRHTTDDYRASLDAAGFADLVVGEFAGDEELARSHPNGARYLGRALLLMITATARAPAP